MERKELINHLIKSDESVEIYNLLEWAKHLIVNYWKKAKLKSFIEWIKEFNSDLYDIINLLKSCKLFEIKDLSSFIRDYKKELSSKMSSFEIKANSKDIINPLNNFLEKNFWEHTVNFEEIESDNLTVDVKWNGYYYKRSLNNDIDKLLS